MSLRPAIPTFRVTSGAERSTHRLHTAFTPPTHRLHTNFWPMFDTFGEPPTNHRVDDDCSAIYVHVPLVYAVHGRSRPFADPDALQCRRHIYRNFLSGAKLIYTSTRSGAAGFESELHVVCFYFLDSFIVTIEMSCI
ncbi:hypothetical protein BaRGS_00017837 [Batillaria attramentaria]|uniref:Uncharacterized protein n=1 Tax=Batillaria attramentaria TaxID=370345 RepID=A0ABD0KUW0_9CAEN